MKSSGLFITGTDTGVGKTLITAGLASALQKQGVDVTVMKPFSCGESGKGDVDYFIEKLGLTDSRKLLNPFHCKLPLAPSVAAKLTGKKMDVRQAVSAYNELSRRHEITLVEGVGGVMVPLTQKLSVLDFIERLNIPVIVVARAGLGTINHTLLTVEALRSRRAKILGIVMNGFTGKGQAEKTNPDEIERLTKLPILARVPYRKTYSKNPGNIPLNTLLAELRGSSPPPWRSVG